MAEKFKIVLNDLTLGQLEELEEATDFRLTRDDVGEMPIKVLTYLAMLAKQITEPDYSMDQARKLHINDLEIDFTSDEEKDGDPPEPDAAA